MKYKNILLTILLILIICLSIQTISASNIVDDSYTNELDTDLNEINEEKLDSSNELLASSNQEIISEVSSDPLPTIETGVVSGGVDFTHIHPWAPSDSINGNKGNITYKIPSTANIKSAYIYVNVYSGSGGTNYGAYANTTLTTSNGQQLLGSEYLWTSTSSQNGIKYIVNDHVDRVYSDYMIFYNVTDLLQGLNGTSVSVDVHSYPIPGKSFDGRIKLISLFVAWDDGDSDEIYYWLNGGQAWTDDTENGLHTTFENIGEMEFSEKLSTLTNLGVSSTDAMYHINGVPFFSESDSDEYINGAYYQYHKWNISSYMDSGTLELRYFPVGGAYGPSFKNVISILTIQDIPTYDEYIAEISLIPEFSEVPSAYAGTNNTLNVRITTKEGNYVVRLLADGVVVNQSEYNFKDGVNSILLTDSTIRPVDELTVNGAENKKVNYTIQVSSKGKLINSSSIIVPVLYNGYLGKDLAYPSDGINHFLNITVNGDIVIDIQDSSHYIGHNIFNRSEVWNVDLDDNSNIVKSFIYVPYHEFNSKNYVEDINMFNVTFNDVNIIPIGLYRDQSNLGNYYYLGYGILLYDVTNLIRNGENRLVLNKRFDTPAVYPSALIYMYNTTGSNSIKEIYIYNGADLLEGISNNLAGRTVHTDTKIDVNSKLTSNATLYIFAAGPQTDEGNLIFNNQLYENIWNASVASNDVYSLDITNALRDSNDISFIATGFKIIALQQIIVLDKNLDDLDISLESEYPDVCYAGTNNYITVNIDAIRNNNLTAKLFADGVLVNESNICLSYGFNQFTLVDNTIRPVDEFSVNGAENKKVNYALQLLSNDKIIANSSVSLNILYNGYLGKDLAYPKGGMDSFLNVTVNGGIVVDVKDGLYLEAFDFTRTDTWNINLDNKITIKSLIYVPYKECNANLIGDGKMFTVKFNGVVIEPIASYRDQSNLGQFGGYGYGLVVYDVTALIKNGTNSFVLTKNKPTPSVYPSTLIYMYNITDSKVIKNIYISNGADLLSIDSNRPIHMDSKINVDSTAGGAELYIFAANVQGGAGNIIFNNKTHENVWGGSASTTDLYNLDISNTIKNNNNVSFVVKKGTILALHQMIVTTQKTLTPTKLSVASKVTTVYNTNKNLVITLKDNDGKAIANAKVTVILNGAKKVLTTNNKGQVSYALSSKLTPKTYTAQIAYDGDANHTKSTAKTTVVVKKATIKMAAKSTTFKVKTKTKKYAITLKDNKGKVMKKVKVTIKVKGKTYKATTNNYGKATFKITKLSKKGKYTATVKYAGNRYYNAVTKSVKITVKR